MITDLTRTDVPELEWYTKQTETELFRFYEPDPGLLIAEGIPVVQRALDHCALHLTTLPRPLSVDALSDSGLSYPLSFLAERLPFPEEGRYAKAFANRDEPRIQAVEWEGFLFHPKVASILQQAQSCGFSHVPILTATRQDLEQLVGYHLTGGVLSVFRRWQLPSARDLFASINAPRPRIALLHHVTNPTNVGAIFRSAAALRMDAILVTSSSSDPLYRRALRTGMGAAFQIPWTVVKEEEALDLLQEAGFFLCAMALTENALSIDDAQLHQPEKLAIILGNEGYGLPSQVINSCDAVCKIPMACGVDSLNVAAASALAFWELSS